MVFFNEAEYAAASNVHDCGIITFHNHDEYTHTHTCQILCVWLTHIFSRTVAKGFYTHVCSSFFHTPLSVFTLSHTHTPAEVNSADYWFTQPTTQQHRWPAPGSLPFSSYSTRERRMGEAEEKKKQKKNEDRRANVWKHNGSRPGGKDRGLQSESRLGNPAGTLLFLHARTWCGTVLWFMFPSWKSSEQRGKCGELDVITQDTGRGRSVSAEEHDDSDGVRDGIILYSDTL